MKLFKAIVGIAAIFALGILTGVLGTGLVVKHRIEMFGEKGPPHVKAMFMKRMTDRLDLTPEQRESVGKILDDLQVQLREIRRDVHPKIGTAFDSSFEKIRQQMSDSQKNQLDKFLNDLPKHFPRKGHFRHKGWHKKHHDRFMPPDEEPYNPESKNF